MASALMVLVSAIALSVSASVLQDKSFYLEDKIPGESFSFNCCTSNEIINLGVYKGNIQKGNIQKNNMQVMNVFLNDGKETATIHETYEKRLKFTGPLKQLSVTITQLTGEDSGIYWCQYTTLDSTHGTVAKTDSKEVVTLLVKEPKHCPTVPDNTTPISSSIVCPDSSPSIILVSFSIVTAVVVFLMFSIMIAFHIIPKIKTWSSAQAVQNRHVQNDSVYEVMSATLRRT